MLEIPEDEELFLDLSEVKNLAEVILNGQLRGIVGKSPYKISLSNAVHAGQNELKLKVTNV